MSNYNSSSSSRRTGQSSSSRTTGGRSGSSARSGSGSRTGSGRSSSGRSVSGRSSSGRSTAVVRGSSSRTSGRYAHRRKKNSPDFTKILLGVIGVLVLILCISLAVKGCGKLKDKNPAGGEEGQSEAVAKEITVDGVDISGMTQEQAKAAILDQYNWNMKVVYEDQEAQIGNLVEAKVNELLDEIYAGEIKKDESYTINTDNMMEPAMAEAALVAGTWNMVPQNGGISGYDAASKTFTFTEGTNGMVIDQEKLAQDIVAAIQAKDYGKTIQAAVKEVSPALTAAQLKEKYKTIATYKTTTTNNSNRNENIRLACEAINGTIINPGQEFSFNEATGARTEAKGYKPATAYLNGEVVQEPGGGVCQVSSTLYNAVIFAGLKSTERHAHSYEPSYVTPGEDAAVSYGGPDFKFVNNSDYPVAIKTSFSNPELVISIYGVPILDEDTMIRMESKKTSDIEPPEPTYEEDQTLQLEEEQVVKEATLGSRWTTELVRYEGGTEVSREHFHNSTYRGKAAIIKRNTSGIVVTTVDPSAETAESLPAESSGTGEQGPAGSAHTETSAAAPSQSAPSDVTGTTAASGVSPSAREELVDPPEEEYYENMPQENGPVYSAPGQGTGSVFPGSSQNTTVIDGGPGSSPR